MAQTINRRGLTLVETVIAATVMALLALSVLTLLPGVMALVERNKQTNIATYLAHDTLELVAARPFETLLLGDQNLSEMTFPPHYVATATVSVVDGYTAERLKRIAIKIEWPYRDRMLSVQQELFVNAIRR